MQTGNAVRTEQPQQVAGYIERGTVVWFDDGKGYGFISRDGGGRDAYVHFRDIVHWTRVDNDDRRKRLQPGERVEFEVVHGLAGKPAAKQVRVIA